MSSQFKVTRQLTLDYPGDKPRRFRLWLQESDGGKKLVIFDFDSGNGQAFVVDLSIVEAEALLTCLKETLAGAYTEF